MALDEDYLRTLFSDAFEDELLEYIEYGEQSTDEAQSPVSVQGEGFITKYTKLYQVHTRCHQRVKEYVSTRHVVAKFGDNGLVLDVPYHVGHFDVIRKNVDDYNSLLVDTDRVFDNAVSHDAYGSHKRSMSIKDSSMFVEQTGVTLSPFSFWLLQEQDPLGMGEVMAPTVNHRMANQTTFAIPDSTGRSSTDLLRDGSTDATMQRLQNGTIVSLPYVIVSSSEMMKDLKAPLFRSPTSFNWRDDRTAKHNVWIRASGIAVKRPFIDVYKSLAVFFGYHLSLDTLPHGRRIKAYEEKVDFSALFSRFTNSTVFNVGILNSILRAMSFPFQYKDRMQSGESSTTLAFAHFAALFRFITPLRLAQLEGGHRTFLLNRVLQGYDCAHSTIPLRYAQLNEKITKPFMNTGTLMSNLALSFVYLRPDGERQSKYGLTQTPADFVIEQDVALMQEYSRVTQDFRLETYTDTFGHVLRSAVYKINLREPNQMLDDNKFWGTDATYFVRPPRKGSAGVTFGTYLSGCLKIMIDELFGSRYFKDSNKAGDIHEALALYCAGPKGDAKLFAKSIVKVPFPESVDHIPAAVYYVRNITPAYKKTNQYLWSLWVSVWFIKTSLTRPSTFAVFQDFLGVEHLQPLLHVKWLHDSIIVPVETLARHYLAKAKAFTPMDRRKAKLYGYLKAVFLEYYLSQLSKFEDIPTSFDQGSGALQLGNYVNNDVRCLMTQIEVAKRLEDDYPSPYLSILCILYAQSVRLNTDETHLSDVIQLLSSSTGMLVDTGTETRPSSEKLQEFVTAITIDPFPDAGSSLVNFIRSKLAAESVGGFPSSLIQVFAPPVHHAKRKSDESDKDQPAAKKANTDLEKEEVHCLIQCVNLYLSGKSRKKEEIANRKLLKEALPKIQKLVSPYSDEVSIVQNKFVVQPKKV